MKAGTTTLFHDLSRHPDLCLPEPKEPEILVNGGDQASMARAYDRHFRSARPGQLKGEASTAYTKRPLNEGVAEIARALCGPDLRIVYIRREPVARALSHYKHDKQHGEVGETFAEAVRIHPRFIDYGRYDWQIQPWIETFGAERVLQFDLEDYSARRKELVEQVLAFLGVDPARMPAIDPEAVSNSASEQKHISNPALRTLVYSDFYQKVVKPAVPRSLRERARRSVLPPPKQEKVEVDAATAEFIRQRLSPVRHPA